MRTFAIASALVAYAAARFPQAYGTNVHGKNLNRCQGDCDRNSDCKGSMVCFQRNGYTKIPGCNGRGHISWDYCIPKNMDPKEVAKAKKLAAERKRKEAAAKAKKLAAERKRKEAAAAKRAAERKRRERLAILRRRKLRQQRLHAERKMDNTGRCYYGRSAYGGCQVGGKRRGNGGGKRRPMPTKPQYYFSKHTAASHDAQKMCKKWGGDLAWINSRAEQDMIMKKIDRRRIYWIGLDDRKNEKKFVWLNGSKAKFTFWHRGEPNNWGKGEDCTCVNFFKNKTGTWNDYACKHKLNFICKKMVPMKAKPSKPAPKKMVIKTSNQCAAYCKSKRHCCNDWRVGSNQMVSCAQACEMRIRGTSKQLCQQKVKQFASKRGQGGCTLTFGKNRASLCMRCKDLDKTCPHGVQNGQAGYDGCNAI